MAATVAIDDILLDSEIAEGFKGGPTFRTDVIVTRRGREQRFRRWTAARWMFHAALDLRDRTKTEALENFALARGGRERGFRFRDWGDDEVEEPTETIEITGNQFRLCKRYASGGREYVREIHLPIAETVTMYDASDVAISPVTWEVNDLTGIVTFNTVLGFVPKATFFHEVPVRFDTDTMRRALASPGYTDWGVVALVELRPEEIGP